MAKSKLELLLEVEGANQAKRALDGVTGELDNMSRKQKNLSDTSRLAGRGLDMLGVAATGMVAAIGVREIAQAAVQLHDLGTASIRAREQLDNLTNGNAPEYINQVKAALRGTVTEMEAATISSNLYGLGLAKSAEEAAELARVSAILGGTFRNLGAAEAAQEFSLLLSNMSLLRLDSFGISSARVKQRMDELQASTANMTKEEAFYVATMEEATRKAEALEGVLEDQRSQVELLKVEWQEAKTAIGEYLAEASAPLIRTLNHEIQSYKHAQESARDLHREIARGATSYQDFAAQVGRANQQLNDAARRHLSLKQIYATRAYYAELLKEIEEEAEAHERRLMDAWAARAAQGHDTARATEEVAEATEEEVDAALALDRAYLSGLITMEEYEAGKRALMTESEAAAAKYRDEQAAMKELEKAMQDAHRIQNAMTDLSMEMAGKFDYVGRVFTVTTSNAGENADLMEYMQRQYESTTEQIARTRAEIIALGDAEGERGTALDELIAKQAAWSAAYESLASSIEETTRSYTATLSDEDRRAIGEGFLQFLKITNQELALTGEALDNYRLQMGLVTQEALEFKAFQEELNAAMKDGGITTEQAAQIWESYATGQVTSAGAAIEAARAENEINQRRQESIQLIRDLEEGNIVMGRAGVVAYTTTAAAAEDAERRATTAIENVQTDAVTQFEKIELAARESFEAMASSAKEAVPGLQHVTQIVGVLESRWMRLKNNPHINLTASISTSGSLPDPNAKLGTMALEARAAGGPVTAGRAYVVGEKGPELFVPNRSGTIVPQNALANGGGQTIVPIYIGDRLLDEIIIDGWVRGVRRRGGDVSAITRGAIQA